MRTSVSVVAVMSLVVLIGSGVGRAQDGFTPVDPSQYPAQEITDLNAAAEKAIDAEAAIPRIDPQAEKVPTEKVTAKEVTAEQPAAPAETPEVAAEAAPTQAAAPSEPATQQPAIQQQAAPLAPQRPLNFSKPAAFVTDNVSVTSRRTAHEADANLRRLDRATLSEALDRQPEPQPVYEDDTSGSLGGCQSCGESCGESCCNTCCPCNPWLHCHAVWGEAIYMRARDLEVSYGVEVDGPVNPPTNQGVQISRVATLDADYELAYRAGFAVALSDYSSIGASFLYYDDTTIDSISRTGTGDMRSMVIQPYVINAASDWLDAAAIGHIEMNLIDVEFRQLLFSGPLYAVNGSIGVRYGHLEQDFFARFTGNGVRDVTSRVQFDGYGIRLGGDFRRIAADCGLFVYGRGNASFLVGEYNASFFQGSSFDPVEVNTSWKAGRVVSILDLELGVGWQSPCNMCSVSAGYMVSGWYNAVAMDQYINAVHNNDFEGLGDVLTFDGAVVRAEVRF